MACNWPGTREWWAIYPYQPIKRYAVQYLVTHASLEENPVHVVTARGQKDSSHKVNTLALIARIVGYRLARTCASKIVSDEVRKCLEAGYVVQACGTESSSL